jgi:hypothetical protein
MLGRKIKLLTNSCCNLFDNGYCVFKEKRRIIHDDKPCKYFEKSVLPVDEGLLELYKKTLEAEAHGDTLSRTQQQAIIQENSKNIKCEQCGNEFKPTSNRQKYCEKCRKIKRNEQQKRLMRNKRLLASF